MLRWRLIIAAVLLLPLLLLLYVDYHWNGGAPGIWLAPVGLLVVLLATAEVLELLSGTQAQLPAFSIYGGVGLIFLASCAPLAWGLAGSEYPPDCPLGLLGWPLAATAVAVAGVLAAEMWSYREPGGHVVAVALGVFVVVYLGLFACFLAELRFFHDNQWGMAALVSVILVAKFADTGAYACGKLLGRHPLAPRLSPKKTIEGAIGGVLTAILVSWLYFAWVVPWMVPQAAATAAWRAVLFGLVIALAGMLGDLCESLLKRDMQRKDSSGWLPGLGGILDVIDSVILAAPAGFLCWAAGVVGPG